MVKLTIVGRVSDGLPLAQGPTYLNEEIDNFSSYKQQAEFILQEISRGALGPSRMTICADDRSFHYLMENGICTITLCDSSYPRKLAFHYLQDLQKEFDKFDYSLVRKITRPYRLVKFGSIIGNIRKLYVDTRTQANLSKLIANRGQRLYVTTEHISEIFERKRDSERHKEKLATPEPQTASSIWGSPMLVMIAMKWTPIIIILFVVLLWTEFLLMKSQ